MRKYIQYLRIRRSINRRIRYHVYMNHWKAARNLCRRLDRLDMIWDGTYYAIDGILKHFGC